MKLSKQEVIAAVNGFLEALSEQWFTSHLPLLVEMRLVHKGYGRLQGDELAADLDWLRISGPREDTDPELEGESFPPPMIVDFQDLT